MDQPVLIDELVEKESIFCNTQVEINGRWWAAKPLPYYSRRNTRMRIYHAWLVLTGKAMAWQYAEDRKPKSK